MSWIRLLIKMIVHKPSSNVLSVLLLAFGVGIIALVSSLGKTLDNGFKKNVRGFNMVVGAKGSPLQLILASIYHLDAPTGNISLEEAKMLMEHPQVEKALPLSFGDNFQGYRIVGCTPAYPEHYDATLQTGVFWAKTMEVTLGALVAERTGLQIGSTFYGSHGLVDDFHVHDDMEYTVVGILNPTGAVVDQLIFTSLESVWDIHADHHHDHGAHDDDHHADHDHSDHDHGTCNHPDHQHDGKDDHQHGDHVHEDSSDHHQEGHEHSHADHNHDYNDPDHAHDHDADPSHHDHAHDAHDHSTCNHPDHKHGGKEITALLIQFRNPMAMMTLPRMVNTETNMQAALPAIEINRLFGLLGVGIQAVKVLAVLLIVLSAFSVFLSLLNTLKENQLELALVRVMGAGRFRVFGLMQGLAFLLSIAGTIVGFSIAFLGRWAIATFANEPYLMSGGYTALISENLILIPGVLVVGFVAALLPAIQAYTMNISKILARAN